MSSGAGAGGKPLPETKLSIPQDQSPPAKAAAPLATLSTEVDPWPHYVMSGACGAGAAWSYSRMNNPRAAAIAGAFAAAYLFAGRLLTQGHERLGYDLGTVTSLALLATTGPRAYSTGEAYITAMATLGGMSSAANLLKAYQLRTGKPKEAEVVSKH